MSMDSANRISWSTLTNVPEADDVPDVGQTLQIALNRVLRWASRPAVTAELAGPAAEGLSPTDLWLLDGIARYEPLRASDIAAWQGVDKSTMTAQLRRLSARGLVDRETDPADGRAVLVRASEEGRRLHAAVTRNGAAVLDALLADWQPADRQELARLLTRFADSTGQLLQRR
jgi:DNA-binding MarR family transcriptional regulator